MPVEMPSVFAQVIQDHLALKEQNQSLDGDMPLDRYKISDPFDNHPLFKSEEQARLEETMDGLEAEVARSTESFTAAWPGEDTAEHSVPVLEDSGLWSRSRDFDWGD